MVVGEHNELKGLITVTDFRKAESYPSSCKDDLGRLRVGAAVGTGAETPSRVEALVEAGVMRLSWIRRMVILGVIERVRWVKANYPQVQVIGGNIATGDAALALLMQAQMRSKSVSAQVQFVPRVLWRVLVCRRFLRLIALPMH